MTEPERTRDGADATEQEREAKKKRNSLGEELEVDPPLREPDDRAAHPEMREVVGNFHPAYFLWKDDRVFTCSSSWVVVPASIFCGRPVRSGRLLIRDRSKWCTSRQDGQGGGGALLIYTQISNQQALLE
jgi:hypothetical protein